jgi:hypothetical protein
MSISTISAFVRGISMDIVKSTRHQKIIGDCGELIICNWLSRSGMEVSIVDHTGIDILAYNPPTQQRIGITVKSRTRTVGKEESPVNIFSYQNGKNDRQKVLAACEAFACDPWLAVYVESTDQAEIYLTSLSNYDAKYRREGKAIDDWKMGQEHQDKYNTDPLVKQIKIKFQGTNWSW